MREKQTGPFPGRLHSRDKAIQHRAAGLCLFWTEGRPTIGGYPADGPRPESGRHRHRLPDHPGSGWIG